MKEKRTKVRDRKSALIWETARYGGGAVIFAALTAVLWFFARSIGIVLLCITCAFTAVAIANFILSLLILRAFLRFAKDDAANIAVVTDYGHLEIFGGAREAAQKYAEFTIAGYAAMYSPADNRPGKEEMKANKEQQKELFEREKEMCKEFSPFRHFDNFTSADLPYLKGKVIFVSSRAAGAMASEEDWEAARKNNEVVILKSVPIGKKIK